MTRKPDTPCPATALTAEVNLDVLGIERAEAGIGGLTAGEVGAALRVTLALMQLTDRHAREARAGQRPA